MRRHPTWAGVLLIAVSLRPASGSDEPLPGGPEDQTVSFRQAVKDEAGRKGAMFDRLREIPPAPGGVLVFAPEADDEAEDGLPPGGRRVLARENLDRAVFGDDRDDQARRDRLGAILAEQIERAARYNVLTPAQRARLRLAGQGDVKRLFDRVAERRRAFELVRKDPRAGALFLRGLYPEQADYFKGPFGADSLYEKTLNRMIFGGNPARRPGLPTILDGR